MTNVISKYQTSLTILKSKLTTCMQTNLKRLLVNDLDSDLIEVICCNSWLQTPIPHICHGRHGRRPCKFFLAGVNFYRLAIYCEKLAIYWEKLAIYCEKLAIDCIFWCKFCSPKICLCKKMTNMRYAYTTDTAYIAFTLHTAYTVLTAL